MKKNGFHPEIFEFEAKCVCGSGFITTSTHKNLKFEICSKCHPFFSGVQKFVDSAGRIERFNARYKSDAKK
jgi:large subunit ribosomal protein L31